MRRFPSPFPAPTSYDSFTPPATNTLHFLYFMIQSHDSSIGDFEGCGGASDPSRPPPLRADAPRRLAQGQRAAAHIMPAYICHRCVLVGRVPSCWQRRPVETRVPNETSLPVGRASETEVSSAPEGRCRRARSPDAIEGGGGGNGRAATVSRALSSIRPLLEASW